MSRTPWQKQQQPLDTLQSMINAVLIETGRALRSANQKGAITIGYTHDRLQAFLPNAIDKFHLALDELEIDIVRAKAVFGRDLRELREKQNQLENLMIPQDEIAESLVDGEEPGVALSPQAAGIVVSETGAEALETIDEEIVAKVPETMNISFPKANLKTPLGSSPQEILPQTEAESQESMQKSIEIKAEDVQTQFDDLKNTHDMANVNTANGLGITISNTAASATSEAPVGASLQGTSFDSIFGAGNAGESDLNFDDFDFSATGTGNQNDEFGGNTGDFDLSSFGDQANNENGDPGSLLQSIDNFDGSGADFNLLDMSNNTTNSNDVGGADVGDFAVSGGDLDVALGLGANESAFDELLNGIDFGDGDDDGTGGNTMEHGEFDDAYFGLNSDG